MAVTTFRASCTIITLRELRHWPLCVLTYCYRGCVHGCAARFDPCLRQAESISGRWFDCTLFCASFVGEQLGRRVAMNAVVGDSLRLLSSWWYSGV